MERLVEVMKVMVVFITLIISCVGFYQLLTGHVIADYSSIKGGEYFDETNRLFGLTTGPGSSGIMLIVSLCFLVGAYFQNKKKATLCLLAFNSVALILTFGRSIYIALFFVLLAAFVLIVRQREGISRKVRKLLFVITFAVLLFVSFAAIGITYLQQTGEIERFGDPTNILLRIKWWKLTIGMTDQYFLSGIGLKPDLSYEFWRHTFYYMTPHNFILAWIMRIGLAATLFLVCGMIFKILNVIHRLKSAKTEPTFWIGYSLILAFVGVFIASQAGSDYSYSVLLLYTLVHAYSRVAAKENKSFLR